MRSHAGPAAMEKKGATHSPLGRAKASGASPAESEAAGAGGRLPKHLWLRGFRIEQGGYSGEDALYQGNEAAILLENNGRYSAKKGSRHIHIRYFFITGRIKSKEARAARCPAEPVAAGYFAKPVQGVLLRKLRAAAAGTGQSGLEPSQRSFGEATKKRKELKAQSGAAAAKA